MGLLRFGLRSGSGLRWGFGLRSGFDMERRNAGPEEYNCATIQKKQCQPWRGVSGRRRRGICKWEASKTRSVRRCMQASLLRRKSRAR